MIGRGVGVTLRPTAPGDLPFLIALYASTREEELALVPWKDAQKQAFVETQYHAQDQAYRARYPDGQFLVVERNDEPIGRLYLAPLPRELRVVDIAIAPKHRGVGIGTALMRDVIRAAEADGHSVSLHVEHWNPALRLYTRLGFERVSHNDVYALLVRRPGVAVS